MNTTANLGLSLPESNDYADISVLNANFQKLDTVVSAAKSAEEYDAAATYAVGSYRTKDGKLYKCTTAITAAEAWTEAHWTETSVGAEIAAAYTALGGKATTQLLYCTVPVSWTASGSFYYQQVSVAGVLSTDEGIHFDINPGSDNAANKLYVAALSNIQSIDTLNGAIKLWATAVPATAFPLKLEVVR